MMESEAKARRAMEGTELQLDRHLAGSSPGENAEARVPREPMGRLFLRFLKFGLLAWGGPVAQIGMIKQDLVDDERWISRDEFNRVLALYQILPGPEAHELCVYFGMRARGRIGGLLAGLGFMLPGFLLMFGLTHLYLQYGLAMPGVQAAFGAVQAAVGALIVRAVVRIASHALLDRWLWAVAALAALAHLAGVHFAIPLATGGAVYALVRTGRARFAVILAALLFAGTSILVYEYRSAVFSEVTELAAEPNSPETPALGTLVWSGLRSGLLTFGGAYTVIPFLQEDAVVRGGWMTNAQFLDGLALSGILPAPLIIFATFVGYLGGGALGALLLTAVIFAPAFAFTLVGHDYLERLVHRPVLKLFLEGVTAGVVGLIAATTLGLLRTALGDLVTVAVFAIALWVLFRWKSKLVVPLVIGAAAAIGLLFSRG